MEKLYYDDLNTHGLIHMYIKDWFETSLIISDVNANFSFPN